LESCSKGSESRETGRTCSIAPQAGTQPVKATRPIILTRTEEKMYDFIVSIMTSIFTILLQQLSHHKNKQQEDAVACI